MEACDFNSSLAARPSGYRTEQEVGGGGRGEGGQGGLPPRRAIRCELEVEMDG